MFNIQQAIELLGKIWKSFSVWAIAIVLIIGISTGASLAIDYLRRAKDLEKSELQSKLLWNNIGQCYFVELDEFNKYYKIVRVQDCDKTK